MSAKSSSLRRLLRYPVVSRWARNETNRIYLRCVDLWEDVFPELPEDANAWWDRCMPQEHEGSLKCRCSYEYNYFNGEFYDHRRAGGYVDLVDRCAGADPGCMSYQRTMDSWQQSNYVKMPTPRGRSFLEAS